MSAYVGHAGKPSCRDVARVRRSPQGEGGCRVSTKRPEPGAGTALLAAVLTTLPALVLAAPVSLDACRAAARADNPGLAAASQRAAAAAQAVTQARSAYYPQLKASAQWVQTDNPPQAFFMRLNQRTASLEEDFNQPDDTDNLRLSAGAAWRLYDFGQREAQARMAAAGADAQRALLDAARNDLEHQVTRAYYGALQAEAFLAVSEESVASLDESLRMARERLAAGSAVKTDALNLEVKLAEAREELIRARNGVELARAALNTAIGRELVGASDTLTAPDTLPARPAAPAASAVEQRGEWRAAQAAVRAREAGLRKARRQSAPAINAFGSLDFDDDGSASYEQSYLVGVAAEVDLFTGGRNRGAAAQALAEAEAARADLARAGNELRLDLRQATLGVGEAFERVDVAGKSLASAEEALRITRERYQQGAADLAALLTAQVGLTATRTRLAAARYDYLIARSNLERAQGLLSKENES